MSVRDRKPPAPPVDWSALQYRPPANPVVLACPCGASYVDDQPSRDAHKVVFGHEPRRPE